MSATVFDPAVHPRGGNPANTGQFVTLARPDQGDDALDGSPQGRLAAVGYRTKPEWMINPLPVDDQGQLDGTVIVDDVWSDAGDKDELRFSHGQLVGLRERRNYQWYERDSLRP